MCEWVLLLEDRDLVKYLLTNKKDFGIHMLSVWREEAQRIKRSLWGNIEPRRD